MTDPAEALLLERAIDDLESGLAFAREEIRRGHSRLVAFALDGIVTGAVAALRVREKMREDLHLLSNLARRVSAGEDAGAIAAAHIDDVLRLREVALVARVHDPEFAFVRDVCLANMARRLPDLARMIAVKAPASYDALVREAFPDRAEVDQIIDDNVAWTLAIVDHIARHPHVLRAPDAMVPRITATARALVLWQAGEVRRGVDEIYSAHA